MTCERCRSANDADALFCTNCGNPLGAVRAAAAKPGWNWRYLLMLAPVLAFAAVIGYYKFYLPRGVAAVVNGEEITRAEVDSSLRDFTDGRNVPEDMRSRLRYAVLSRLITERIAAQEARRNGMTVSQDDVNAAVERRRAASGRDENEFAAQITERYGSMAALRKSIEQQLLVSRYIDAKVTAGAADAASVSARTDQWLRDITRKAEVRIAIAEELSAAGSGCGCCGGDGATAAGQRCDPRKGPAAGTQPQSSARARDAQNAARAYWKERNGDGPVDTKIRDFGCHIQVDIVKDNRIAKSLRYQNGTITEM